MKTAVFFTFNFFFFIIVSEESGVHDPSDYTGKLKQYFLVKHTPIIFVYLGYKKTVIL